jgi:sugar phosphate isomerase/epimerase
MSSNRDPRRDVFVSTTSFRTRDLPQIFALCDAHGIDAVELSVAESWSFDLLRREKARRRLLAHNYFPPPAEPFLLNLASQDPENLRRSIEHCHAALDLSAELGAPIYAAHGGFGVDLAPGILGNPEAQASLPESAFRPYERIYATLVDAVRDLCSYAAARGVRFLIENNVLSPLNGVAGRKLIPMAHPQELLRLVRDVNEPGFGLLIDVGHANVSATALDFDREDFFTTLEPHIAAFHLSDNDGIRDQNRPFDKNAWFMKHLARFPDAVLTLELNRLEPPEILAVRNVVLEAR